MSNASVLGAIEYEAESAWAEDVTTFATHQLPIIGEVDASGLTWEKENPGRAQNYRGGGEQWIKKIMGGSFKTRMYMVRGVTMVGSPSLSAMGALWGIAVGNHALSLTTSQTCTGGTAAAPTTSGATGISAGGLVRIGALGDGDGNGQFYVNGSHAGSAATLIGAMDGAPLNGAVIYPVEQIYASSGATSTDITGTRFRFLSGNLGYEAHGCYATAIEYPTVNTGEIPIVDITWGVSWWRHTATTLPSAVTSSRYNPGPIAAGSFNAVAVATTTRTKHEIRGLSVSHTLAVTPQMGPGGVNAYQGIVGAKRGGHDVVSLTWTVNADAATATPAWHALATAETSLHVECTLSVNDGTAVGFKCPKVCITNVPTQRNDGGINRLVIEAQAYTGDTTTNDLTRAQIVWGLA
jgi:hypothetical protein